MIKVSAVVVTRFYSKVTLELDDDDDLQDLEWRLCERSEIHKAEPETEALDIMITKGE